MELNFTYNNHIKICVPKKFSSTWNLPATKITHRKKRKIPVYIKPLNKNQPKIKIFKIRRAGTDKIFCDKCNCYYQRRIKQQHLRTKKHLDNV